MEGGGGERERLIEKGGREGVENWEGGRQNQRDTESLIRRLVVALLLLVVVGRRGISHTNALCSAPWRSAGRLL